MLTIDARAEIVTRRQCSFCGFYPGKVVPISPTPHTISAGGDFNLARLVKARVVRFFCAGIGAVGDNVWRSHRILRR
jgi:hypothetical protein